MNIFLIKERFWLFFSFLCLLILFLHLNGFLFFFHNINFNWLSNDVLLNWLNIFRINTGIFITCMLRFIFEFSLLKLIFLTNNFILSFWNFGLRCLLNFISLFLFLFLFFFLFLFLLIFLLLCWFYSFDQSTFVFF